MFGPRIFPSSLTIPKILGGINKTLGVVNQIIPLYKEAKPMVNNARNALNLLKEMGSTTTTKIMTNTEKNLQPLKEKINNLNIPNQKGPTFFQ